MKRPQRPTIEILAKRYGQLASQLAQIGFMLKGNLSQRLTRCGNRGCQCHADPPQLHGPYWQWNTLVNGKRVTRLIGADQIASYQQWIDNRQQAEKLLDQMQNVSSEAATILLAKTSTSAAPKHAQPSRRRHAGRQFVRGK